MLAAVCLSSDHFVSSTTFLLLLLFAVNYFEELILTLHALFDNHFLLGTSVRFVFSVLIVFCNWYSLCFSNCGCCIWLVESLCFVLILVLTFLGFSIPCNIPFSPSVSFGGFCYWLLLRSDICVLFRLDFLLKCLHLLR